MNPSSQSGQPNELAAYLTQIRQVKGLTLRQVEEATENEISNAYLSQLEHGKISRPSPNTLHTLSQVYGVPYSVLMEKAGYIPVASSGKKGQRQVRVPTFAVDDLTKEEEEELLKYLGYLRSQR